MRPKSSFLGQYDLFYTCDLIFYARENNGLHIAKECCPLKTRASFRTDWRSASIASCMCDMVARVSPTGGHNPELYDLVTKTLDFLADDGAKLQLLYWFELQLLAVLGLAPRLSACSACNSSVVATRPVFFSPERGGIICHACSSKQHSQSNGDDHRNNNGMAQIKPDELAILKNWQNNTTPRSAFNTRCSTEQMVAFRKLLGIFLGCHLDLEPASRDIVVNMMTTGVTR
jgi:DNA repair protein RecO (recombination protein O)